MAVDDEDLLASIAGHLVGSLLQKIELQMSAVGNGSRLVFGLENLPEVILRKDHRIFLFRGMQGCITHLEQIRPQRQMCAMLLQDAERQKAGALRLLNGGAKLRRSEFL